MYTCDVMDCYSAVSEDSTSVITLFTRDIFVFVLRLPLSLSFSIYHFNLLFTRVRFPRQTIGFSLVQWRNPLSDTPPRSYVFFFFRRRKIVTSNSVSSVAWRKLLVGRSVFRFSFTDRSIILPDNAYQVRPS